MQQLITNPDVLILHQNNTVPNLNEWEALFAKADTSMEPEFADWDITLMDGLD